MEGVTLKMYSDTVSNYLIKNVVSHLIQVCQYVSMSLDYLLLLLDYLDTKQMQIKTRDNRVVTDDQSDVV